MKYYYIHILTKDFTYLMSYFIIMKYNITNETFLPAAQRNFPGATDMQLSDMLLTTLFYFWSAILISFATYYIIFLFVKPVLNSNNVWSNLIIGFLLSLTTPILFFYMSNWKWNYYYESKAGSIAWVLYFIISVILYHFLNSNPKKRVSGNKKNSN